MSHIHDPCENRSRKHVRSSESKPCGCQTCPSLCSATACPAQKSILPCPGSGLATGSDRARIRWKRAQPWPRLEPGIRSGGAKASRVQPERVWFGTEPEFGSEPRPSWSNRAQIWSIKLRGARVPPKHNFARAHRELARSQPASASASGSSAWSRKRPPNLEPWQP